MGKVNLFVLFSFFFFFWFPVVMTYVYKELKRK